MAFQRSAFRQSTAGNDVHFFFFIRTKFIRTPTLRLFKKTKNNSRLQKLLVLKFDLCSY